MFLYEFSIINMKEWKKHKEDFVKMTAGFVEELELPDSKTRVTTYEAFFQEDVWRFLSILISSIKCKS